jgi:hypothetical protein
MFSGSIAIRPIPAGRSESPPRKGFPDGTRELRDDDPDG